MPLLDVIALPSFELWRLAGLQSSLLEAAALGETTGVLLVHAMAGRAVSLGRYHLYDGPAERGGISAWRRLTGGRAVGSGEGWIGLSLTLPSPGALLEEGGARLRPEQVMNRYVRGLLSGLRALGLECFYPGRDAVTRSGREVAMCSFEVDASGATLFEAAVAVNRGMEQLVYDLEGFDPDGRVNCPMYSPETASTLIRELGRDVTFDQIADAIVNGYAQLLGGANLRELSPIEIARADHRAAALESSRWLVSRAPDPDLTLASRKAFQLGTIEARLRLGPGGAIGRIQLSGDFIANSSGIQALEGELTGCRLEFAPVLAAVMKTLGNRDNFMLGIGEPVNLVKLITGAR